MSQKAFVIVVSFLLGASVSGLVVSLTQATTAPAPVAPAVTHFTTKDGTHALWYDGAWYYTAEGWNCWYDSDGNARDYRCGSWHQPDGYHLNEEWNRLLVFERIENIKKETGQ